MNRLALLDWDRSLYEGWTLTSWIDELASNRLVSQEAPDAIAGLIALYRSEQISHDELAEQANCRYAAELRGRPAAQVDRLAYESSARHRFHAFARPLLDLLNASGVEPVVVTGAPVELIRPHARTMGLGRFFALTLEVAGGCYTGRILSNPGHSAEKLRIVKALSEESEACLALGDSASDGPLLAAAGFQLVVDNPDLAAQYRSSALAISTTTMPVEEVLGFVCERVGRES